MWKTLSSSCKNKFSRHVIFHLLNTLPKSLGPKECHRMETADPVTKKCNPSWSLVLCFGTIGKQQVNYCAQRAVLLTQRLFQCSVAFRAAKPFAENAELGVDWLSIAWLRGRLQYLVKSDWLKKTTTKKQMVKPAVWEETWPHLWPACSLLFHHVSNPRGNPRDNWLGCCSRFLQNTGFLPSVPSWPCVQFHKD